MEQLVQQLHDQSNPPSPARVREIERQIQQIQHRPGGWAVGLDLLHNEVALLRFYGALTLTIKINADWSVATF